MDSYSDYDILRIEWNDGRGKATVSLSKFFPCTKAQFNKLNRLIDMDWKNYDALHEQITKFFKDAVVWCEFNIGVKGKSYWETAESRDKVKHRMVGRMVTKQELRDYKKYIRDCEKIMREDARDVKKFKKDKEWFETQLGALHEQ